MTTNMKYIVVDTGLNDIPILFDTSINHSDMAGRFTVVSAGFVFITNDKGTIKAYAGGRSLSLGIVSRPEIDSKIIEKMLERATETV